MLSQVSHLIAATDGRYATDQELMFFQTYLRTARLRFSVYQKLQAVEQTIVQEVLATLRAQDPTVLTSANQDITAKWQRDTVRVLRYTALAVLLDDPQSFKESILMWFQTVMRAFRAERSCHLTYQAMQEVVRRHFTPEECQILVPILELSRMELGAAA